MTFLELLKNSKRISARISCRSTLRQEPENVFETIPLHHDLMKRLVQSSTPAIVASA